MELSIIIFKFLFLVMAVSFSLGFIASIIEKDTAKRENVSFMFFAIFSWLIFIA